MTILIEDNDRAQIYLGELNDVGESEDLEVDVILESLTTTRDGRFLEIELSQTVEVILSILTTSTEDNTIVTTASEDFQMLEEQRITFSSGTVTQAGRIVRTIPIALNDDLLIEGTEKYQARIAIPDNVSLPNGVFLQGEGDNPLEVIRTGTILDDDSDSVKVVLTLDTRNQATQEGDKTIIGEDIGTITASVSLQNTEGDNVDQPLTPEEMEMILGPQDDEATVRIILVLRVATHPDYLDDDGVRPISEHDFEIIDTAQIIFTTGNPSSVTIRIRIENDDTAEQQERMDVWVDFINTPANVFYEEEMQSLFINDDALDSSEVLVSVFEAGNVSPGASDTLQERQQRIPNTVSESSRKAIVEISLTSPLSQQLTLEIATEDGTATASQNAIIGDYEGIETQTLIFMPEDNSAKTLEINLIRDQILEPNETFFIVLNLKQSTETESVNQNLPSNFALREQRIQVTILEDEFLQWSITGSAQVEEGEEANYVVSYISDDLGTSANFYAVSVRLTLAFPAQPSAEIEDFDFGPAESFVDLFTELVEAQNIKDELEPSRDGDNSVRLCFPVGRIGTRRDQLCFFLKNSRR